MHLADAFIQSDLQLHSGYTFFISICVPWESNPQPLCGANAMLYHWATQDHKKNYDRIMTFFPTKRIMTFL